MSAYEKPPAPYYWFSVYAVRIGPHVIGAEYDIRQLEIYERFSFSDDDVSRAGDWEKYTDAELARIRRHTDRTLYHIIERQ